MTPRRTNRSGLRRPAVRGGAAVALLTIAVACASLPRPRVFAEVDAVRASPAAQAARELAPQAFLVADQLRTRAHAAHDAGDLAGAQILSEHAIAAYEHAFVLARRARAEARLVAAESELRLAERALADLDEQQQRTAADADALELRIRIAGELLPLPSAGPTGPERERARHEASRALLRQAHLLCTAARLLDPDAEGLSVAAAALAPLEQRHATPNRPAPIDETLRARSGCLAALTQARRSTATASPDPISGDALLAELTDQGGHFVFRDDRGVVVLLRDLFTGRDVLTERAAATLAALGEVARAHSSFPLLVVLHGPQATEARGERLSAALRAAGAERVETALAGVALPVVDPTTRGAAARNERVEIVFVVPRY